MGMELIVEKYKNDLPGYTLCGYGEVGFPQYKVRLLCLMLKDKGLPVIDEYILRLYKENIPIDDMSLLLGIDQELVSSSWYNLIHLGLIHIDTKWITEKGYSYLREHTIESNEKIYLDITIDALSGEIKRNRMYINRKTIRETNLDVLDSLVDQPSVYNLKVAQLKKVLSEYQKRDPETYAGNLVDIIEVDNKPTQYKRLNILIFKNANEEYRFMVCDDSQRYEEYESALVKLEESGKEILKNGIGNYFEKNDLVSNQKFTKESNEYLSPLQIRNYTYEILQKNQGYVYISLPLVKTKTPDDYLINLLQEKAKTKSKIYIIVSGREFIDNFQKNQYEKIISIRNKFKNLFIINVSVYQNSVLMSENQGVLSYLEKHELKAPASKYGITETGFLLNEKESKEYIIEKFKPLIELKHEYNLISKEELKNKILRIVQLVTDFDDYLLSINNIGWIGGGAIPDVKRLFESPVANTENDFKVFISSMHTSLGESLEKNGKAHGDKSYFWNYFKSTFPDLHKVLHKIRIYRHSTEHISLEDKPKENYFKFLDEDLDGSMPFFKENGYRILQTKIILNLEEILEKLLLK
ncbi:hypothetical protein [Cytobacillus oceanisediminis]|uniref:hypothetical protein n=1 Tax=Cytobacillus oceanisediminis TaxID=665099 RepID=UPI0020418B9E|nr:hypothetical protein [Cytobacillus oceanisediminis]MCM3393090.1 hypothetical protein [Cytobacillus oceanisediminis]